MRVIVMFDLPVTTSEERAAYGRFRRDLIKDGFLMMQESVYCKLAVNAVSADLIKQRVNRIKPAKGVIQLMIITEKQYSQIDYLRAARRKNSWIRQRGCGSFDTEKHQLRA